MNSPNNETPPTNYTNERSSPPSPSNSNNDQDNQPPSSSPLLFSCRCESAKAVTTLLSCLRHVSLPSSSENSGSQNVTINGSSQIYSKYSSLSAIADSVDRRGGGSGGGGATKSQLATVYVTPDALTFHVHGLARQSQASVDMQAGLFSDYYVASETIPTEDIDPITQKPIMETVFGGEFCVNLPTVLECLHVLGTANLERTKLCLSYDTVDAIFKIELEEWGVLSTCAIAGSVPSYEYDEEESDQESTPNHTPTTNNNNKHTPSSSLTIAFRKHPVVARSILKSEYLRDAISELADINGASCCTIGLSPHKIELGAVGHAGECLVELPKNSVGSGSVFVSLECNPPRMHVRSYPLNSLLQGMRGLDIAHETCVSINARGMIAIQHQVLDMVGSGQPNFVDFLMGAIEEDSSDEEDDDDDADVIDNVNNDPDPQEEEHVPTSSYHTNTHPTNPNPNPALPNNNHDEDDDNNHEDNDNPTVQMSELQVIPSSASTNNSQPNRFERNRQQRRQSRRRRQQQQQHRTPPQDRASHSTGDTAVNEGGFHLSHSNNDNHHHDNNNSDDNDDNVLLNDQHSSSNDNHKRKHSVSSSQPPPPSEEEEPHEELLDGSESPELLFGGTRILPDDTNTAATPGASTRRNVREEGQIRHRRRRSSRRRSHRYSNDNDDSSSSDDDDFH